MKKISSHVINVLNNKKILVINTKGQFTFRGRLSRKNNKKVS